MSGAVVDVAVEGVGPGAPAAVDTDDPEEEGGAGDIGSDGLPQAARVIVAATTSGKARPTPNEVIGFTFRPVLRLGIYGVRCMICAYSTDRPLDLTEQPSYSEKPISQRRGCGGVARMTRSVPRVCVVGSSVMDLVASAPRRPMPGETVIGTDFAMHVGGKGVNQALAAARAGATTTFVGKVGDDDFGDRILAELAESGVETSHVRRIGETPTGVGMPLVEPSGENSIVFVAGANDALTSRDVARASVAIEAADVVLIQLELPLDTAETAAKIASNAGTRVVLNPAPARPVSLDLLALVDILVPNEVEVKQLAASMNGHAAGSDPADALIEVVGGQIVVVTRGADGVEVLTAGQRRRLPAMKVDAVDTVGAGDAFCGNLAARLADGADLFDAVTFANAAGALATLRSGAGPAMPSWADVQRLVETSDATRAGATR